MGDSTSVHFPAPTTWLLGCRGTSGASLARAVFSQPQSSWAVHMPSLPPFRPPECPGLTLCFALEISEGFKDSSLDSTQTMFLLGMYTGGGRLKVGRVEPTPFQNEATPPSAWLSWSCPPALPLPPVGGKMQSLAHSHSSSGQGLGVHGAVHSSYKAGRHGGPTSQMWQVNCEQSLQSHTFPRIIQDSPIFYNLSPQPSKCPRDQRPESPLFDCLFP